jgi:hypothetical protein
MGSPRLLSAVSSEPVLNAGDGAARFYRAVMGALRTNAVPFLLGGTYALCHHAKFARTTKDLDVFIKKADLPRALSILDAIGFRVETPYPHWLAKVHKGDLFADIIFSSGNGVAAVDDEWFSHAEHGNALGIDVLICPAEETLWSKGYIMERERYDGADVAHLLRACSERLDWPRLIRRFGSHWRVLLSHLVLFGFSYPAERDKIPRQVIAELSARLLHEGAVPDQPCRGTLLSREQYLVDIKQWGYEDARRAERTMDDDAITAWTSPVRDDH